MQKYSMTAAIRKIILNSYYPISTGAYFSNMIFDILYNT